MNLEQAAKFFDTYDPASGVIRCCGFSVIQNSQNGIAPELSAEVSAAIDDAFEYHRWDDAKTAAGVAVRQALATAVKAIVANVPPCPDRTTAIRKLREARMDANSAITYDGKY